MRTLSLCAVYASSFDRSVATAKFVPLSTVLDAPLYGDGGAKLLSRPCHAATYSALVESIAMWQV